MKKKKYCVKGIINDLLPKIEEYVWAYSKIQAWKIITIRLHKKYGWWYKFSNEKIEITEIS